MSLLMERFQEDTVVPESCAPVAVSLGGKQQEGVLQACQ